jgi:hypothetical protein
MNKAGLTKEGFDKLLLWLDPDRNKAGEKYEKTRLRLIRIFACRSCCDPEDLADQCINVIVAKIDWLIENYRGDPALYFYGVAKKIYRETLKPKSLPEPPPPPDNTEIEQKCSCLAECLKQELTSAECDLVLKYHEKNKQEKIRLRKQLAQELGISINALRIRIWHMHARLRPCVERCMRQFLNQ